MREKVSVTEEKKISFWLGKISPLLNLADAYQLEIIYNFILAFLK